MALPLSVADLVRLHAEAVARWHEAPVDPAHPEPFGALVMANHAFNFRLWHEEDQARDPAADDAVIAQVKRNIDRLNQQRTDAFEKIDDWVVAALAAAGVRAAPDAPLNSETVGSIVDRLSILALKVFHMDEQARRPDADEAHRLTCAGRLAVLTEQRADLAGSLEALVADLWAGRKRFKVYRQMKMYNDPALNPVLYGKGRGGA